MRNTEIKWGLPLSALIEPGFELHPVPPEFNKDPASTFDIVQKFEPHKQLIEDYWGYPETEESLRNASRHFPLDPYFDNFSFDELAKYMFSDVVMSEVSEAFERHSKDYHFENRPPEPAELVYKLRSSMHHYGRYPSKWNDLVAAYNAIPLFNFGPDFEVRFDHSRSFNTWGRAQHVDDELHKLTKAMPWEQAADFYTKNVLYLDGIFAYFIYLNGKHVMTIGFSVGDKEIFINQIQLRESKGNRWLYKIPLNYFNYAIEAMYRHFSKYNFKIYLVDGTSLADSIKKNHAADNPLPIETYNRIIRIYSLPLLNFSRGFVRRRISSTFYQLLPNFIEY